MAVGGVQSILLKLLLFSLLLAWVLADSELKLAGVACEIGSDDNSGVLPVVTGDI